MFLVKIHLVDFQGKITSHGCLEVPMGGKWGAVCVDGFHFKEDVVCHHLDIPKHVKLTMVISLVFLISPYS